MVACVWIAVLSPEDISNMDVDNPNTPLPEKLKYSYQDFVNNGDDFKYNLMLFMTLFNTMGNDISPTKNNIFLISAILMLIGFLIVGNLIGEFSNILNEISENDINNEIEENQNMVT